MTDDDAPRCPDCDGEMRVRTRRSDGEEFWGCMSYPGCSGTRPISAARDGGADGDQDLLPSERRARGRSRRYE